MEQVILDYNLPYTKEFVDEIYKEEVAEEIAEEIKQSKVKYHLSGNFEHDVEDIKKIIVEETGIKWNSGKMKIELQRTKRHNGTSGIKAIASSGKTIQNFGDFFNIGSVIKWLNETK